MLSAQEQAWLVSVFDASVKAGHIWPAMAAWEAALEATGVRANSACKRVTCSARSNTSIQFSAP